MSSRSPTTMRDGPDSEAWADVSNRLHSGRGSRAAHNPIDDRLTERFQNPTVSATVTIATLSLFPIVSSSSPSSPFGSSFFFDPYSTRLIPSQTSLTTPLATLGPLTSITNTLPIPVGRRNRLSSLFRSFSRSLYPGAGLGPRVVVGVWPRLFCRPPRRSAAVEARASPADAMLAAEESMAASRSEPEGGG